MSLQVVYVARNPKDVIVSYFYYHKLMDYHQYSGDMETFAEYFMNNSGKHIGSRIAGIVVTLNNCSVQRTLLPPLVGCLE